jgi:hypothetical protein
MDEFQFRGPDAVFLEYDALRAIVLPEMSGNVLEFRDKRTDTDVLWHADHNWHPPANRMILSFDATTYHDHYSGGWQVTLPVARYTEGFYEAPYGLHGESALVPFPYDAAADAESAELSLHAELVCYLFVVERTLRLPAGEARLEIEETVTNEGEEPLPSIWQHRLALGQPLLGSEATLEILTLTGVFQAYAEGHRNVQLTGDARYDWLTAPGEDGDVDLTEIPPPESSIHDVAYATDLEAGRCALLNPTLKLRFTYEFPADVFKSV